MVCFYDTKFIVFYSKITNYVFENSQICTGKLNFLLNKNQAKIKQKLRFYLIKSLVFKWINIYYPFDNDEFSIIIRYTRC